MAKIELVEDPGVTSLFDDSAPAPKLEPVDDPAVKSLFDAPVEPATVPQGTSVAQEEADPRPRLRSEAFQMLKDSRRLSPRVQQTVADEDRTATGSAMQVLGAIPGSVGEAIGSTIEDVTAGPSRWFGEKPETAVLNEMFGGGRLDAKSADDIKAFRAKVKDDRTAKTLDNFIGFFEGNGITDGKEMMNVLKDSIRENTWDPTTDDKARVLSDGTLRINPKFVALPDPAEGIAAINAAPVDEATRKQEIERFTAARKIFSGQMDQKTRAFDPDYKAYAEAQEAAGNQNIFYSWPGLNRNFIEKSWDVVRDTAAQSGRNTMNTVRGVSMGLAELQGKPEDVARIAKDIQASSEKSAFVSEMAAARGQEGPVLGTAKELGTTVIDMIPMFAGAAAGRAIAGAAESGAARQILGKITQGTSVYGYAGAQGYASMMQSALDAAERKAKEQGRELTVEEINKTVSDAQGAALANGLTVMAFSKLMPEGAEKAALNGLTAQAGQLTGRDVLRALKSRYGEQGVRGALMSLKPELKEFAKQAYTAAKTGFKDEAIEEGVTQLIEGMITKMSGVDADKTWDQIGQDTWKATWMGGVVGSGLPVATKVLAETDPAVLDALRMVQDAAASGASASAAEAAVDIDAARSAAPSLGERLAAGRGVGTPLGQRLRAGRVPTPAAAAEAAPAESDVELNRQLVARGIAPLNPMLSPEERQTYLRDNAPDLAAPQVSDSLTGATAAADGVESVAPDTMSPEPVAESPEIEQVTPSVVNEPPVQGAQAGLSRVGATQVSDSPTGATAAAGEPAVGVSPVATPETAVDAAETERRKVEDKALVTRGILPPNPELNREERDAYIAEELRKKRESPIPATNEATAEDQKPEAGGLPPVEGQPAVQAPAGEAEAGTPPGGREGAQEVAEPPAETPREMEPDMQEAFDILRERSPEAAKVDTESPAFRALVEEVRQKRADRLAEELAKRQAEAAETRALREAENKARKKQREQEKAQAKARRVLDRHQQFIVDTTGGLGPEVDQNVADWAKDTHGYEGPLDKKSIKIMMGISERKGSPEETARLQQLYRDQPDEMRQVLDAIYYKGEKPAEKRRSIEEFKKTRLGQIISEGKLRSRRWYKSRKLPIPPEYDGILGYSFPPHWETFLFSPSDKARQPDLVARDMEGGNLRADGTPEPGITGYDVNRLWEDLKAAAEGDLQDQEMQEEARLDREAEAVGQLFDQQLEAGAAGQRQVETADMRKGDKIVIDGVEYTVDRVTEEDGTVVSAVILGKGPFNGLPVSGPVYVEGVTATEGSDLGLDYDAVEAMTIAQQDLETYGEKATAAEAEAEAANAPKPYSIENLQETFNLTADQAVTVNALVRSMGIDTSKIQLKRGGRPGAGLRQGEGVLTDAEYQRHADLEARKDSLTPDELWEAEVLVDRAARGAGYSETARHGTPTKETIGVFGNRGALTGSRSATKAFFFSDSKGVTDTYRMQGRGEPDVEKLREWADSLTPDQMLIVSPDPRGLRNYEFDVDLFRDVFVDRLSDYTNEPGEDIRYELDIAIAKAKSNRVPFPPELDAANVGQTIGVRLKIENPYRFTSEDVEERGMNAVIDEAIAGGHDGVISSDRVPDAFVGVDNKNPVAGIIYAVFDPAQIKSADPFIGVPLRERFNPASPSILFQFAGEKANVPQFMADSLETAKAMAAEGKDSETIRAVTGWFPGMDGKMRWEIPDEGARMKAPAQERAFYPLSEILDHPALFEAYPELRNLDVREDYRKPSTDASFSYDQLSRKGFITLKSVNDGVDRISILLHEIQHAIQRIEGFAVGSTPAASVLPTADLSRELLDFFDRWRAVSKTTQAEFRKAYRENFGVNPPMDYNNAEAGPDMLRWLDTANELGMDDVAEVMMPLLSAWQQRFGVTDATKGVQQAKFAAYQRTAGEIEARDVQARRTMTPEQRAAVAPYSTQNIAPEDAIILFQDSKSVTDRSPSIRAAAIEYRDGRITQQEYLDIVKAESPAKLFTSVPAPASNEDLQKLDKGKRPKIGGADNLPEGTRVGLRLDIPVLRDHGVGAVTIHQPRSSMEKGSAGSPIGYASVARVRNARFATNSTEALKIATGEAKQPLATIEGEWVPATPAEVEAAANEAINDPAWVQVGMNPIKHSWFYNRADMRPMVAAEEILQVGSAVFAKNPTYASPSDPRFMTKAGVMFQNRQGPKGSMEWLKNGIILLRGLINPDVSTAIHEMAHVARRTLLNRDTAPPDITEEDIKAAEEWAGAKDGKWSVAAEEKFARGFERYFREGKAPNQQLASVFTKIGNWLKSIYPSIKGTPLDVKITPEIKALFDKLVTRNQSYFDTLAATPAEPVLPEPPAPQLDRKPDPDNSPTGLRHADTDADRARLGLRPRYLRPPTTDEAAWNAAIAAEDAHKAADLPGTAGGNLLTRLMSVPARALTKPEHALLLHEKLVRQQEVDRAQTALNRLPESASFEDRKLAQSRVTDAQAAFDTLITYADAAGSASGLSLQARKMLIEQDFSLAAVSNRMRAEKNVFADKPQDLTPAEKAEALKLSIALRAAQDRASSLASENKELAAMIERLTADVIRAQAQARPKDSVAREKIKKFLDPKIAAAKARLEARNLIKPGAPDVLMQSGPTPNQVVQLAQDIADVGTITAGWLVLKTYELGDFTGRLAATFGDWVIDHAETIFNKAKQTYNESAATVTGKGAASPQMVLDGIDGVDPLTRKDVWDLARAHVISGVRGEAVLDAVFEGLSPLYPDLTRDAVAELFTNYGKVTYPDPSDVPRELRRIGKLESIALKLTDVLAKRGPKRTGFQREEQTENLTEEQKQELERQKAEIRQREKEFKKEYRDLEEEMLQLGTPLDSSNRKLKSALGAAKRRMQNEIEELQLAIDRKTPRVTTKTGIPYDEEGEQIKERLAAKREEYAAIFAPTPKEVISAAQQMATRTAKNWLAKLSKSQSDTLEWTKKPDANPMADLLARHVKSPVENFTDEAIAIGATAEQARVLDALIAAERKVIEQVNRARSEARNSPERKAELMVKALDRQIAEEEKMIADGIFKRPKGTPFPDTPETTARREKLAELRQTRRDLYEAQNPGQTALEQAKAAAVKSIQRLEQILQSGEVAVKQRKAIDPDAELDALWATRDALSDEVAELRRALPISPEKEAADIRRALEASQKTLARLEDKIARGDITVPPVDSTPASRDSAVQAVRARIKELNKELARMRRDAKPKMDPEEARLNRRLASIQKRRAELERRIRENDFSEKAKPAPLDSQALRDAENDFKKLQADYAERLGEMRLKNAPFRKKFGRAFMSTGNLLKVLTLGGDVGVLFRQLKTTYRAVSRDLTLVAKSALPGETGKMSRAELKAEGSYLLRVIGPGLKSFMNPNYEFDVYDAIMNRPNSRWDKVSGMVYAAPFDIAKLTEEDLPPAKLLESIPWWFWPALAGAKWALIGYSLPVGIAAVTIGLLTRPGLMALDRAQRVMTNQSRALWFDDGIRHIDPHGTPTVEHAKQIARFVMVGTGRGSVGPKVDAAIPVINQFLLATRYYISQFQSIVGAIPVGVDVATWFSLRNPENRAARKEIAKMYGQALAGRAVVYGMMMMALKSDDEDEENFGLVVNPYSKDFGRLRLTDKLSIDFMSGTGSMASVIARYFGKRSYDVETKQYTSLGAGTENNVNEEVTRFLAGKMNLQLAWALNTHAGAYFGGKTVNYQTALDEATTMIITNDVVRIFEELGPVKGAAVASMLFTGAGTSIKDTDEEIRKLKKQRQQYRREQKKRERRLNQ